MCWPSVETPTPSTQELEIYDTIDYLIQQQMQYYETMMPLVASQMHYTVEEVPTTEAPQNLISQRNDIQNQMNELNTQVQTLANQYANNPRDFDALNQLRQAQAQQQQLANQMTEVQTEIDQYTSGEMTTQQWTKMSDEEWYAQATESERKAWDVYQASLERQQKALAGELPLSETLQQQKEAEFEQLRAAFPTITGESLEEATASDTIGVQNLTEFKKRWASVEEAERYGALTTGMQTTIQSQGLATGLGQGYASNMMGMGGVYGTSAQNYMSLLQPYQAYNTAGYQTGAYNQATAMQGWSSLLGLTAMLGGAAIVSSKKHKKDIKEKTKKDEDKALRKIRDTKSYEYRYKDYVGMGDRKFLGSIAEESPDEVTTEKKDMIVIPDKLELLGMGIKSLARKIDKLHPEVA